MIAKHQFTITYEASVNTDTGEILETKIVSKSPMKEKKTKKVEDDGNKPTLYLEENKYRLNSAAIQLMGIEAGDKLDIKYEESKNGITPIIGSDEAFGTHGGNKISSNNTVIYRGKKMEELSKFGNEFGVVTHPNKEGLFMLTSDNIVVIEKKGDENIQLDEEDVDLNLEELIDDKDAQISEIDSNFFNFNL